MSVNFGPSYNLTTGVQQYVTSLADPTATSFYGRRYVFSLVAGRETVRRSAVRRLLDTFFGGSAEAAVATLLDVSHAQLTDADFERLQNLIERARKEER